MVSGNKVEGSGLNFYCRRRRIERRDEDQTAKRRREETRIGSVSSIVMAPRRTSKRMNAAIKGLQPFGFHRNTILKTVNRLLKAYGGDHGWTFIEEDSYKLVIETILADQEEKEAAEKKEENAEVKMEDSTACSQNANDVNGDTNFAEGSINLNDIPIYRSGASEPTIPLIRKRPPCYGWISESEDESDEPPCQC